jgi:hypothetical protein
MAGYGIIAVIDEMKTRIEVAAPNSLKIWCKVPRHTLVLSE